MRFQIQREYTGASAEMQRLQESGKLMDSYTLAHRRMAPLLEAAREFDIATNPHPLALFEAGSGGLQIWCTPADNPGGLWEKLEMYAGAFSKPCVLVASVHWPWSEEEEPTVTGLWLTADAYEKERARSTR